MTVIQRMLGAVLIGTAACAQAGRLGVLGGMLGTGPVEVDAVVQGVDTLNQIVSITQTDGRSLGLTYDSRTQVTFQNRQYPVASLRFGDRILARMQDDGGSYYTDSIAVMQPINGAPAQTNSAAAVVRSLQGTVREIDRANGTFTVDASNGAQLTVVMPERRSAAEADRFSALHVGDVVRFTGVFVDSRRVALRTFD